MQPVSPRRKTLRAPNYDYTSHAVYFVTICLQTRTNLLGEINQDGSIELSDQGLMVRDWWLAIADKYPTTTIDEFIIMPDHVHGILWLENLTGRGDAVHLGQVVGWFKARTRSSFAQRVKRGHWVKYGLKLWQRGFYDHIIRDDRDLATHREYISNNPWRSLERRGQIR